MKRRKFIQAMGMASGGLMSTIATSGADKKIVPYLIPAEGEPLPGQAVFYPTSCGECPANCGVLVRVREGTAVKLEGNPAHPVNSGALCMRGQASLARLHSRNRLTKPLAKVRDRFSEVSWEEADGMFRSALDASRREGRRNLFLRSQSTGSLQRLIGEFCNAVGVERLPEFETFHHGALKKAYGILFDRAEVPLFRIDRSDLLVSLGADILETFVNPVGYGRQIAASRAGAFRWVHAEPHLSQTGSAADDRIGIRPESEPLLLAHLLHRVRPRRPLPKRLLDAVPHPAAARVASSTSISEKRIAALIDEIDEAVRPLVVCGGVATMNRTGLSTALLTGLLQWTLGAVGERVDFSRHLNSADVGTCDDLKTLESDLSAGDVGVFFLSGDLISPVLSRLIPASGLGARFQIGLFNRMTPLTEACDLVLPPTDPLETWGDAEPFRGWFSLLQPVQQAVKEARSEGDILLRLMGRTESYERYLQTRWREYGDGWLQNGFNVIEGASPVNGLRQGAIDRAVPFVREALARPVGTEPMLVLTPSTRFFDGRSRDIDLLNEIPDPVSTISYGRWLGMSGATAERLKLEKGDEAVITTPAGKTAVPVLPQADLPTDVLSLSIAISEPILPPIVSDSGEMQSVLPVTSIGATGRRERLCLLSTSTDATGRGILPEPRSHHHHGRGGILYPEPVHRDFRWAMAIDLDLCTGCSACVAACYIENNVPMTGADEHRRGREMSWLRIAPYRISGKNKRAIRLPMLCQQCTYAPCEPVCPVYATYHNPEGLNAQVYNRCVGTRYCANNCPYKARRFNWDDDHRALPLAGVVNPDVSRRPKGVMEKCTFCVQRIRKAKDDAKNEDRQVRDGEIVPACAQTCPSGAITFGNLLDTRSRVYKLAHSSRSHRAFESLGTEPAVFYLKEKGDHDR